MQELLVPSTFDPLQAIYVVKQVSIHLFHTESKATWPKERYRCGSWQKVSASHTEELGAWFPVLD